MINVLSNLQPMLAAGAPALKPLLASLQAGQILQALVLQPTASGRALLDINGTRLLAGTDLPLRTGEVLTVKVEKANEQPLLRVLQHAPQRNEIRNAGLRSSLPRQVPLPPLLANLAAIASGRTQLPATLPVPLKQVITETLQALPQARQASNAEGLKQAMTQSGLGFEHQVARAVTENTPFPVQNLKANLLKLAALLRQMPATSGESRPAQPSPQTSAPTPSTSNPVTSSPPPKATTPPVPPSAPTPAASSEAPVQTPKPQPAQPPTLPTNPGSEQLATELRHQTEGALSRITAQQLHAVPQDDPARQVLMLEIPLRNGAQLDVWGLKLERELERDGKGQATAVWSVKLAFELENLGAVSAHLSLRGGELLVNFWASEAQAVSAFREHLGELRRNLTEDGLRVGEFNVFHGQPAVPTPPATANSLVNVKV